MKNNSKKNKYKIIITILLCMGIVVFFSSGLQTQQPVEDMNIISGIGNDIETVGNNVIRSVPMSIYIFKPQDKLESILAIGTAATLGETRQSRQLSNNKQSMLGLEKVFIISEAQSRYGINDLIDFLFKNPTLNDNAYVAICKGTAEAMLNIKINGYASSADYIEGLIKNSVYYNFLSGDYTVSHLFYEVDSEGRNLVLPYIEKTDKGIQIAGMALFNKDKIVAITNVDDLKIMMLMRDNDIKGMLTIQKNSKDYIDYYATSNRKISCTKEGGKYKFTININLKGDVASDTLYKGLEKDPKKVAEFNNDMSEKVKKECNNFILKMKNEYKVDCLQLGEIAAAKYGRHTGVDWNSIVCNSKIEVNVKVQITKTGRGDY